jgi:hypothetical protein
MIGENSIKNELGGHTPHETKGGMIEVEKASEAATPEDLKLSDEQTNYIQNIPILYRTRHERAMLFKISPRRAIAAKCYDCCCWDRTEVYQCTAFCCPLYRYRPQKKEVSNE